MSGRAVFASTALIVASLSIAAPIDPAPAVPPTYMKVAREYGIPPARLYGLARRQSATRLGPESVAADISQPWPWTVSTAERRSAYRTRLAAYRALHEHLQRGRRARVGLLQLDWSEHADSLGDPWAALDPAFNLRVGAHLLRQHFQQTGSWAKACARFASGAAAKSEQLALPTAPTTSDDLPFPVNRAGYRQFASQVRAAAARHRIDPALLAAVIAAESNFDPGAISPVGAQGLMQLMPATARRFNVTDAFDPVANINGGARYLRWLLDEFGRVPLALAGYNAGENAVIRHGRTIPPYPETQAYVPRVLAFHAYFKHSERVAS